MDRYGRAVGDYSVLLCDESDPQGQSDRDFWMPWESEAGSDEALMKKPEHRSWAIEVQNATGHPDEADLEDGKEFARWMTTKARSL